MRSQEACRGVLRSLAFKEGAEPYHVIPLSENEIKDIVKAVVVSDSPKAFVFSDKVKFHINIFVQRYK